MSTDARQGSLACVGLGMMLGAHLAPRARSHIEQADAVFVAASDALVEQWVMQIRPDARSLQAFYADGKSRLVTYREMIDAMLAEVRRGRHVCGAFYGHPGVFARVPHEAIAQARAEGFPAVMEPGISAEDCLYADLGLDPGRAGCLHLEASQLLLYRRVLDVSAVVVLWQVGVVGDASYSRYATSIAERRILVERLLDDYPADHRVTLYEAATLPISQPRIEAIRMDQLVHADMGMQTTLVIPPLRPLVPDEAMRARLAALRTESA